MDMESARAIAARTSFSLSVGGLIGEILLMVRNADHPFVREHLNRFRPRPGEDNETKAEDRLLALFLLVSHNVKAAARQGADAQAKAAKDTIICTPAPVFV